MTHVHCIALNSRANDCCIFGLFKTLNLLNIWCSTLAPISTCYILPALFDAPISPKNGLKELRISALQIVWHSSNVNVIPTVGKHVATLNITTAHITRSLMHELTHLHERTNAMRCDKLKCKYYFALSISLSLNEYVLCSTPQRLHKTCSKFRDLSVV